VQNAQVFARCAIETNHDVFVFARIGARTIARICFRICTLVAITIGQLIEMSKSERSGSSLEPHLIIFVQMYNIRFLASCDFQPQKPEERARNCYWGGLSFSINVLVN